MASSPLDASNELEARERLAWPPEGAVECGP